MVGQIDQRIFVCSNLVKFYISLLLQLCLLLIDERFDIRLNMRDRFELLDDLVNFVR